MFNWNICGGFYYKGQFSSRKTLARLFSALSRFRSLTSFQFLTSMKFNCVNFTTTGRYTHTQKQKKTNEVCKHGFVAKVTGCRETWCALDKLEMLFCRGVPYDDIRLWAIWMCPPSPLHRDHLHPSSDTPGIFLSTKWHCLLRYSDTHSRHVASSSLPFHNIVCKTRRKHHGQVGVQSVYVIVSSF